MGFFNKQQPDNAPRRRQGASESDNESLRERDGSRSFRRNRTITGSSSRKVATSTELNGTVLSPRAQVHHLSKHRRHLGLKLIGAIVVSLSLYLLVSQLVATVSVRMSGTSRTVPAPKTMEYEQTIDEYFSRHPLSRYYPATDQVQLVAYLQEKHPEIDTAKLSLTGEFGKAQAAVALRKPVARWVINGENEYVDGDGVVFAVSGFATPDVTIVDQNNIALDRMDKKIITSNRFLVFVGQTVGEFTQHKRTVTRATIPLLTTRQLQVKLKGKPYFIKMTIDRPAGEQVEDAARVIRYVQRKDIKPSYIDVRVKGKAFYK